MKNQEHVYVKSIFVFFFKIPLKMKYTLTKLAEHNIGVFGSIKYCIIFYITIGNI